MASLDTLLENPTWDKIRRYTFQPPNSGAYQRWPQGSIGANSPMWLYSNEYGHLAMKHGQNDLLSYTGGVKRFSPSVNGHLQTQVHSCSDMTLNPAGCQQSAIAKVYSVDAHHTGPYHLADLSRQSPVTPHPYGVSYRLGYPPQQYPPLQPWGPQN